MRTSFQFPYVEHDVFLSKARTGRRRTDHPAASVPASEEVVSEIGVMLAAHLTFVTIVILALMAVGIQ